MEKINKIQISPNKIIPDALVIWNEPGPEVDIVMDLKNLTFKEGSIERIYSFHVMDHLFPEEVLDTLRNWKRCLSTGGRVYILVDDFEYIARGFVGGDLSIDLINDIHNHPMQFTQQSLASLFFKTGFKEENVIAWYSDIIDDTFSRKHYELVVHGQKHD